MSNKKFNLYVISHKSHQKTALLKWHFSSTTAQGYQIVAFYLIGILFSQNLHKLHTMLILGMLCLNSHITLVTPVDTHREMSVLVWRLQRRSARGGALFC